MNRLQEQTARTLNVCGNKRLLIGVSGGRDSMCLLHAVLNCGAVEKQSILVVHVNHSLRAEADSDQEFVRRYCADNAVAFKAVRVDVRKESADSGHTIEQAARNLRYEVFNGLVATGEADIILTAHHALDNAETVLMHLFRGAGLDGSCGMGSGIDMDLKNRICADANMCKGSIVRPFLNIYPQELDEYVKEFGIEYVVDTTNFEDDADRNFIRLKVIPLIEQRYRGAVRAINEFAAECVTACSVLESSIDTSLIVRDRDGITVKNEALESPIAARYVRRALEYFTTIDITRKQVMRVVRLKDMRTGAVAELSNGIKAARDRGGISLYLPRPIFVDEQPLSLGANYIDGLAIDVTLVSDNTADKKFLPSCEVDLDKLDGATIRFRRDGDRFTPCGGKHKKLKQFFIDEKIACRDRDRIPLICKGSDVLVVVGIKISDSVKPTHDTSRRARIIKRW